MTKTGSRYSLGSNILYSLKMQWHNRRSTLVICGLAVVAGIMQPFFGMLLPKLVLDELTNGATANHFITVIGSAAGVLLLLRFLKGYCDEISEHATGTYASFNSAVGMIETYMIRDFELLEHPDMKLLEDKALQATQSNHTPAHNIPRTLVRLLINVGGFILYGSVISVIHPVILLLLLASALINWLFLSAARKYEENTREERSKLHRKLMYMYSAAKDPAGSKDIRLYSVAGWVSSLFENLAGDYEKSQKKVAARHRRAQLADGVLILIRDGGAYAFLLYLLLQNRVSLGDFVFVFAAIGAFAGWVSGIILQVSELFRASLDMSHIRTFRDVPDVSNTGEGIPLPKGDKLPPSISLVDVSYTYPKASSPTLAGITLHIKPGERIALVGSNGAGKTTLVKLLCGLYRPTSGTILLAGEDAAKYNRDDYFSLFSTVFQDIHLLTADIAGNISQLPPEETDSGRVEQCLKMAGFYDKVQNLSKKEKTMLVRKVNDEAIELSGGEKQKLAMARALYKDAPVIILDEPTAALDPIAENEDYQKYAELTKGKTSLYISHRLASTRFCDRILFIDNHTIVEMGTHDELMALNGKYAAMFEIQAHYYKEEEGEKGNEI